MKEKAKEVGFRRRTGASGENRRQETILQLESYRLFYRNGSAIPKEWRYDSSWRTMRSKLNGGGSKVTEKPFFAEIFIRYWFIIDYQLASRIAYLGPRTQLFQKNWFSVEVAEKISWRFRRNRVGVRSEELEVLPIHEWYLTIRYLCIRLSFWTSELLDFFYIDTTPFYTSICLLRVEIVTEAEARDEVVGIRPEFLAHPRDVDIHGAVRDNDIHRPYQPDKIVAGEDATFMLQKDAEDAKLCLGKLHLFAIDDDCLLTSSLFCRQKLSFLIISTLRKFWHTGSFPWKRI